MGNSRRQNENSSQSQWFLRWRRGGAEQTVQQAAFNAERSEAI